MSVQFPVNDLDSIDKESLCYNNNIKLKRAQVKIPYTQEQMDEFIKCKQDIHYFIRNYVTIVNLDVGQTLFDMYPYQEEMIDTFKDNRFSICLTARQMGKCVTSNVLIKVRNKKTGEYYELPIGDFYEMQKHRGNNQQVQSIESA